MADVTIDVLTEEAMVATLTPGKGDTSTVKKFAADHLNLLEADLEVRMAAGANRFRVTPINAKKDVFAEAVKKSRLDNGLTVSFFST